VPGANTNSGDSEKINIKIADDLITFQRKLGRWCDDPIPKDIEEITPPSPTSTVGGSISNTAMKTLVDTFSEAQTLQEDTRKYQA
jgi:hypothetical protein